MSQDHRKRPVPRFAGIKTFMNLPHSREEEALPGCDVAVVGLPFDTGASHRVGARFGPGAIREISALIREYNPFLDLSPTDHLTMLDYGDSPVVPGNTPGSLELIEDTVAYLAGFGAIPMAMGGDHTVSLPALRGVARHTGPLALVHFDSHPDTWDGHFGEKFTHATPFRRAVDEGLILPERSIQLGIRGSVGDAKDYLMTREMGFTLVEAHRLLEMSPQEVHGLVSDTVGDSPVYLTFDVDFLDPAFAPGTGTPEIGGPTSAQALAYLRGLDYTRLAGCDVVEVLPAYDSGDITSLLAANIMFEIMCLVARARFAARD